jgi:hypothetical protein
MANFEAKRMVDGFTSLERGMDSGRAPSLLPRNQAAYMENLTVRGGFPMPRPGFRKMALEGDYLEATARKFQGAIFYDRGSGQLVVQAGGYHYRIGLTGNIATITDITNDPNPSVLEKAFMVQAEQYVIIQDGQSLPVIYDGATCRRALGDEVPIGSGPMAYGMGRLWVADGSEYLAGDIVGGATGVLKFTENTYLSEGGRFSIPLQSGQITSMQFTAAPNTALGQGELLVATPDSVFSCQVPTDRTIWKDLTYPTQTILLITNGSQSQESMTVVNSDVFVRSKDGIRSIIQAVRNFRELGNVPVSREMERILPFDSDRLQKYTSAIVFDNRFLMTAAPRPLTNGCYFENIVALDFDLISSMGERSPAAYDGVWSGLNALRLIKGRFSGVDRAFAFARSKTNGYVSSVLVTDQGSGYTSVPPVVIAGNATGGANMGVVDAIVNNAGTGYVAGENIYIVNTGATYTTQVVLKVESVGGGGAITGISVKNPGSYSVMPTSALTTVAQASSNGAGTTATFDLDWGVVSVDVSKAGTQGVTAAIATAFGSGYAAGDDIYIVNTGATYTRQAVIRVETVNGAGKPLTFSVKDPGEYSVLPTVSDTVPQSGTSGSGINVRIELDWGENTQGTDYTEGFAVTFTDDTTDPALATARVDFRWELWEITKDSKFDQDIDDSGNWFNVPIQWIVETPEYDFPGGAAGSVAPGGGGGSRWAKKLMGAHMTVDRVTGTVSFDTKYREDSNPCWVDWYNWSICAKYQDCGPFSACRLPLNYREQARPRMALPEPPNTCNEGSNTPSNIGRRFALLITGTGFCRIRMLEVIAHEVQEELSGTIITAETCRSKACSC